MSVHRRAVGGTVAVLPWIPVPHLVCSGLCNFIECLIIEPNTTTLIETQLNSKHFLFIYLPQKYIVHRAKRQEQQTLCVCFPFSITAAFRHVIHPRLTIPGLGM